jgi:superfamily II DNA or RNA helicase
MDYILEDFKNFNLDPIFNIKLNENLEKQLYDEQINNCRRLISCMNIRNKAIDCSPTGTGKTYTALAVAKQLRKLPLIICPLSSTSDWRLVCKIFDLNPIILNYGSFNKKCDEENLIYWDEKNNNFKWKIKFPNDYIFIWDEVHNCKNIESYNGKALLSTKKFPVLMISATVCDNPKNFIIFGFILGLFKSYKKGQAWMNELYNEKNISGINPLVDILIPEYGGKMKVKNIYSYETNVQTVLKNIPNKIKNKIDEKYFQMKKADKEGRLSELTKLRESIEKEKIPYIIEEIEKEIKKKSILVFLNFKESLEIAKKNIEEKYEIECSVIRGGQTTVERQREIENFQSNRNKIILIMIQSGSSSLSLHDKSYSNPRVSLISPSFSGIDMVQAIGRTSRKTTTSNTYNKIIYLNTEIESKIEKIVKNKLNFLNEFEKETLDIKNFI